MVLIHSTVVATVDAEGHPVTRVIDMMLHDDNSLYFLTAKGKVFLRTADGTEVYRNQRNDRRRRLYEQKGGFPYVERLEISTQAKPLFVISQEHLSALRKLYGCLSL